MRHVVLPQAIRVILPPIGNEFISLLKDSSLVSVVAVADLTRRGREFMSTHFNPIEVWTMVALLYLVLTLFSARIVNWIERRTKFER
jgi:polar amino acid transport system permease protein